MCSKAGIAAIRTRAGNAVLPCCQSIRVMTPPPPYPALSLTNAISSRGIHTIQTTHRYTHTHSLFLPPSAHLASLSLSPRPPYLLAFLPVADALS